MTRPENADSTTARRAQPEASETDAEDRLAPQRTATGDGEQKTVRLPVGAPEHARKVGAPEHARGAVREPANRPERVGQAHDGFAPGFGPPAADGGTRRMPPASMGDQDGRGGEFAPPTVRIAGERTPPERVPPAPSPALSGVPSGATPRNTQVRPARVPRRTHLQLQRLEPWSVLKLSMVLSIAGFLAWMVAVGVLYGVLAGMGVWDQINGTYSDLTSGNNPQAGTELISGGRVFGVALVVGLVNIVLMTALATVGSLIYNVAADLVGGVEVTLSEPD